MSTKFSKLLSCAIVTGCIGILLLGVGISFQAQGGFQGFTPAYLASGILLIAMIFCIVGCIKHRNDPKPVVKKLLAQTSGFHMSGLPYPGTPDVLIKLYRESIEFEVHQNLSGTRKQMITLDLDKVRAVRKTVNLMNTQAVSQTPVQTINGDTDNSGYNHDLLSIDYTSNGEDKQILICLPVFNNANKFVVAFEKLKPQSNQPIEL